MNKVKIKPTGPLSMEFHTVSRLSSVRLWLEISTTILNVRNKEKSVALLTWKAQKKKKMMRLTTGKSRWKKMMSVTWLKLEKLQAVKLLTGSTRIQKRTKFKWALLTSGMTKRKMIKASKVKLPWADKPTIYPNKKDPLHLLAMLSEHTKYNVVVTPINK